MVVPLATLTVTASLLLRCLLIPVVVPLGDVLRVQAVGDKVDAVSQKRRDLGLPAPANVLIFCFVILRS